MGFPISQPDMKMYVFIREYDLLNERQGTEQRKSQYKKALLAVGNCVLQAGPSEESYVVKTVSQGQKPFCPLAAAPIGGGLPHDVLLSPSNQGKPERILGWHQWQGHEGGICRVSYVMTGQLLHF